MISPAQDMILRGKIAAFQFTEQSLDELIEALMKHCKSMRIEELGIITSINGMETGTSTTVLAEIGNIDNYPASKNLAASAGIDFTVYQSGKYAGSGRISKRGNRHLRPVPLAYAHKGHTAQKPCFNPIS